MTEYRRLRRGRASRRAPEPTGRTSADSEDPGYVATVDDVYNYLTGTIKPQLDTIEAKIGPAGWVSGDPTAGDWAKQAGDQLLVDSPAYYVLQLWMAAVEASPNLADLIRTMTDPSGGTMNNAITTSLNVLYDIVHSYLSTTPEFDHPDSILKALYKGIFKTFTTDD